MSESKHTELAENYKHIWLEPLCCVEERSWCEDPQPCDDCGLPSIKYVRADLVAGHADLLAACREFVRKVDAGEARSSRSYAQMKAAIAKAEPAP